MLKTYPAEASPLDMMDGRRIAWRTSIPGQYKVYGRAGTVYRIRVYHGIPFCTCPAGRHLRPCWHAALTLARLQRELSAPGEASAS